MHFNFKRINSSFQFSISHKKWFLWWKKKGKRKITLKKKVQQWWWNIFHFWNCYHHFFKLKYLISHFSHFHFMCCCLMHHQSNMRRLCESIKMQQLQLYSLCDSDESGINIFIDNFLNSSHSTLKCCSFFCSFSLDIIEWIITLCKRTQIFCSQIIRLQLSINLLLSCSQNVAFINDFMWLWLKHKIHSILGIFQFSCRNFKSLTSQTHTILWLMRFLVSLKTLRDMIFIFVCVFFETFFEVKKEKEIKKTSRHFKSSLNISCFSFYILFFGFFSDTRFVRFFRLYFSSCFVYFPTCKHFSSETWHFS